MKGKNVIAIFIYIMIYILIKIYIIYKVDYIKIYDFFDRENKFLNKNIDIIWEIFLMFIYFYSLAPYFFNY